LRNSKTKSRRAQIPHQSGPTNYILVITWRRRATITLQLLQLRLRAADLLLRPKARCMESAELYLVDHERARIGSKKNMQKKKLHQG